MAAPHPHTHPAAGARPRVQAAAASAWVPFRHAAFSVIWIATVVSNIGSWMYSAASSWMMSDLDPDPLVVSLVQVATSLPVFLFAIPAGALADIVEKRRFLLIAEGLTTLACGAAALLVSLEMVTPAVLLGFTFVLGAASALTAPAWQSVVPLLVPRSDLPPAIAANSAGVNISRALGPALGGLLIAAVGIAAPFWINALSNLGILAALAWWRSPPSPPQRLPAERFFAAMRIGFRHAAHNRHLAATILRAVGFFVFASAYWALLPLVARQRIAAGPATYGLLLGAIGAGAVGGAFALPRLKARLGPDRLVAAGSLGTAVALLLFAQARAPWVGLCASLLAGVSWIAVLATLNVSAQLALPDWVRGRGLAIFATVFFGAMTLGSAVWGQVAVSAGLAGAQDLAAAGMLLMIVLSWRWKLQTGAGVDLTPSMHWPTPVLSRSIHDDRGPVLVTVEYRVDASKRDAFLEAMEHLEHGRRRDGAYAWGIFEDVAEEGRYLETFLVESWLEHLRQHQRVTHADRVLQESLQRFQVQGGPKVTHLVAAQRSGADRP